MLPGKSPVCWIYSVQLLHFLRGWTLEPSFNDSLSYYHYLISEQNFKIIAHWISISLTLQTQSTKKSDSTAESRYTSSSTYNLTKEKRDFIVFKNNGIPQGPSWKETQIYAETSSSFIIGQTSKIFEWLIWVLEGLEKPFPNWTHIVKINYWHNQYEMVWIWYNSDAFFSVNSYHWFGVSVLVSVMDRRADVSWICFPWHTQSSWLETLRSKTNYNQSLNLLILTLWNMCNYINYATT